MKKAECQTSDLSGISIDSRITEAEERLRSGCACRLNRDMVRAVQMLNKRMLCSLNGLISFKEEILRKVTACRLYTTNYPLLIEHIIREAKLYRRIIRELEQRGRVSATGIKEMEMFWNQIMMEHAEFIRGLLDPTENELIQAADEFAKDYKRLLEEARERDACAMELDLIHLAGGNAQFWDCTGGSRSFLCGQLSHYGEKRVLDEKEEFQSPLSGQLEFFLVVIYSS